SGVVVRTGENYVVAAVRGGDFNALNKLGKEGVGNVGYQQADGMAPARGQASGMGVWVIIAAFDRPQYLLAGRIGHEASVIYDVRDRGSRDAGLFGHVLDSHSSICSPDAHRARESRVWRPEPVVLRPRAQRQPGATPVWRPGTPGSRVKA